MEIGKPRAFLEHSSANSAANLRVLELRADVDVEVVIWDSGTDIKASAFVVPKYSLGVSIWIEPKSPRDNGVILALQNLLGQTQEAMAIKAATWRTYQRYLTYHFDESRYKLFSQTIIPFRPR